MSISGGASIVRGLVINRFELAGISIGGFSGSLIEGNFLGTNASGTAALGNGQGLSASRTGSHTIGGTTPQARNLISGNRSDGVFLSNTTGSGLILAGLNKVQGNYIGTDVTGSAPLGNGGNGVHLLSTSNTIGGESPGAGNTIAFNGDAGVLVRARSNSVLSNSIQSNSGLGIGGSAFQRVIPVLTLATSSRGTTSIEGSLTGPSNATFVVQFFSNHVANSLDAEGEIFLGSAVVTTDDAGSANFQCVLPASVSTGRIITATATSANGATSIFSAGLLLTNLPPVNTVPGDQTAAEDLPLVISGLSVSDDDAAGILTVEFTVVSGTLMVNYSVAGGVAASGISGNSTSHLTLTGTQAQINTSLGSIGGLTYVGSNDFSGLDTLTMSTTDAGGLSDTDTVAIEVLSAQQQADLLTAAIADLADDGVLNGGVATSLTKMVNMVSTPNGQAGINGFTYYVGALVRMDRLTQEQADELVEAAESISASLA